MTTPAERYRPAFHFTPRQHWINDPNGLTYRDGRWHLYYQYNPAGDDWGNMSWGHASSPDLVSWTEHAVALANEGAGPGAEAIYSGSIVNDEADSSRLGTGARGPQVAIYTSAYGTGRQAQSLAWSDDGTVWTKCEGNPVLDRESHAFRDPKVTWWPGSAGSDGYWLMAAVEAEARQVVFYRSADLRDWRFLSAFGPLPRPAGFWECPDLFELPVDGDPGRTRHVLILSANDERDAAGCGTWYALGHFDGVTFASDEAGFRRLDFGWDCYAAVTWNDAPSSRRVLIGWMSNWSYAAATPTHPWRGAMTIPRELTLETRHDHVILVQRPVDELRAAGIFGWDITVGADPEEVESIELGGGPGETTSLTYHPRSRVLTLDRRTSGETSFHPDFARRTSVPVGGEGPVRLHIITDSCSVEVFVNDGETVLTSLVFPSRALTLERSEPDPLLRTPGLRW